MEIYVIKINGSMVGFEYTKEKAEMKVKNYCSPYFYKNNVIPNITIEKEEINND